MVSFPTSKSVEVDMESFELCCELPSSISSRIFTISNRGRFMTFGEAI